MLTISWRGIRSSRCSDPGLPKQIDSDVSLTSRTFHLCCESLCPTCKTRLSVVRTSSPSPDLPFQLSVHDAVGGLG
eukprot:678250-Hanusia_phi.AAC.2